MNALSTRRSVLSHRASMVREVGLVLAASLFVALCARIQMPGPVPFTMQTFAVLVIAGALGAYRATATMLAYLAEGAAGLPVFAKGTAGIAYFLGETGGYLIGFVIAAFVTGWIVERFRVRGIIGLTVVFMVGHALILGAGFAWQATLFGTGAAFAVGVAPFLLTSVLKSLLAAVAMPWARGVVSRIR
ncbi:MAG TPA: biotin transporter BioY [Phycisphaerae bacterium]|nr:biotin transporter BioY [Phycisphaerae bacterium]